MKFRAEEKKNQSGDLDHAACSRKDSWSRKLKGAQERYLLPDLRKISKHRDQAKGFKSWAKNTNKKTPKARTCTGTLHKQD
jgi:hypothetical protein